MTNGANRKTFRVLGVDPGLQKVGIGVIDVAGPAVVPVFFETIQTKKTHSRYDKMHTVYDQVLRVIREYHPDVLALEDVFYGHNVRVAIRLGEARAIAILAARVGGIEVREYLPTRVKEAICGNGRAAKQQVQKMVTRLLRLSEEPAEDAADGLAVALCHAFTNKLG